MKIFISVGEPSGDLHGANLVRDLKRLDPGIEFTGFAGPRMQAAGCESLFDLTTIPIMFFLAVLRHYLTFRKQLRVFANWLATHSCDAVVLIDYPGFNWHIARIARKRGVPVFYYGVPQMWAWGEWRIRKLQRNVDHVLCKLPFEPAWFQKRGVKATFVGHPFYDEVQRQKIDEDFVRRMSGDTPPLLVLLPGSRNREVDLHWPVLRDVAKRLLLKQPGLRVAVACFSPAQANRIQNDSIREELPFDVFSGRTPELIRSATSALACSGSVSLELLAARLPTVIVYRLSRLQHVLANRFLRCRFITLVNLMALKDIERSGRALHDPAIAGSEQSPMPEFLHSIDRTDAIAETAGRLLFDPAHRERSRQWLDRIASKVAHPGASHRAALYILQNIRSASNSQGRRRAA